MTVVTQPLKTDSNTSLFMGLIWDTANVNELLVTSGNFPLAPSKPIGTVDWIKGYRQRVIAEGDISVFDTSVTGSSTGYESMIIEQTSATNPDDAMAKLVAAAETGNEDAFITAAKLIDWRTRSPEDYVRAVQLALTAGAHLKARQLAAEGSALYPDHDELQKYAHVLAPPKILARGLPPDPNAGADMRWLKAHWEEYRGQWVALRGGELLGVASTWRDLIEKVGNPKGRGILVTRV